MAFVEIKQIKLLSEVKKCLNKKNLQKRKQKLQKLTQKHIQKSIRFQENSFLVYLEKMENRNSFC